MKKILAYLFIVSLIFIFFWQFFLKGLLPIPSDTIVGLYHPFRDFYAKDYPNGIPFKNFLVTDPVRQQIPWRELVVSAEKMLQLPLWNPYSFAGAPLLANFQSGAFYFFNILFFMMPFQLAWSLLILLGPLLGGVFMFAYLDNLRLNRWGSLLGAISYAFCGFFVAWMEWGTVTHVALWLPLILLSIDKLVSSIKNPHLALQALRGKQKSKLWYFILIFSLVSSFFAGHLQVFFYLFIFSWAYFLARWFQSGLNKKILSIFIILNSLFIILTAIQWIPTLQLILLSGRNTDIVGLNTPGWFIPWQNLIQFVAPDFFGNPATLNYWGVWNYGEFVGYAGVTTFVLVLLAISFRYDKKTLFFGSAFFLSLIFSLPTLISQLPFLLRIPFVETSQPTRLLFIADFSLAVLAGLGLDYYLKNRKKIIFPLIFVGMIFVFLWGYVLLLSGNSVNIAVAKNNLIFPSLMLFASALLLSAGIFVSKFNVKLHKIFYSAIILLVAFDLLRFAWKFTPFTNSAYFFPGTQTISFLQKQTGQFRIATTDSRILPPNFSSVYQLQSLDGYDPLYLLRYGELIAAMERGKPDINSPFGFNRIITPHNYDSKIMDLLGVKYVLSLFALNSSKLTKVFQEGQTIVYENQNVFPRAFFVKDIITAQNKNETIKMLFDPSINLLKTGIVENDKENLNINWSVGSAKISEYSANKIVIDTENSGDGVLILTDTYYPTWKVVIDNNPTKIYLVDYNFRGVIVPEGKHRIKFYNNLF